MIVRVIVAAMAVALGIVAVVAFRAGDARQATPQTTLISTQHKGSRLIYPPGSAHLALPDGREHPVRSLLNVTRPLRYGEYLWDERGISGGPAWIRIDLALQTISVFRGNDEVGTAVVLFGADGKPTPPGIYPILSKAEQHRSSLYDAEMPFTLQLTMDGIAIHASSVRAKAATHGCIGVPIDFARRLFAEVKRGDLVAIMPASSARPKQG